MNKTLFGLALLSYNWETYKRDIIDSHIPLVCQVINSKSLIKTSREEIQSGLIELYGIRIPLGAIESILKRMSKEGILSRDAGEFIINSQKVNDIAQKSQAEELDIAFSNLTVDLMKYASDEFSVVFEKEEIESGLISFFRENDLDILFADDNNKLLPKVKESKKATYIIAKFITELQSKNPTEFSTILKLAKGHAIASLITSEGIANYSGSLSDVEIYLDAPIIFNILGLNGTSNLNLSKELIENLNLNGAKLRIFETNLIEVIRTIQDTIERLTSKNYDLIKSSRLLKTAVRENISPNALQIKLNQIEELLETNKITKATTPTLNQTEHRFQIDEAKLTSVIEDIYRRNSTNGTQKTPFYRLSQIERDVECISSIFKIRKRQQAVSLKTSKALLLTSNEYIAYAAKSFERENWEYKSNIPTCVTDIFLATILWANYPQKNEELNIKQLMSECYAIIELDNKILSAFHKDVAKMRENGLITAEQFYLLSASNTAYRLLEQRTLNDIEEYSDKTPSEILHDIELSIKSELNDEKDRNSKIDTRVRKISGFIAKSTFIILAGFLIGLSVIFKIINPKLDNNIFNDTAWGISIIIGVFGFFRWMELIPTKSKVESTVENYVYNKIKLYLDMH